VKLSLENIKSK